MTARTPRGREIGDRTRGLAEQLAASRAEYWAALLARPQLAGPQVAALRRVLDTKAWDQRLLDMVEQGRRSVRARRKREREQYRLAVDQVARWLAGLDRAASAANACYDGISMWAHRRLPDDHPWQSHRIYPARTASRVWCSYWDRATRARRERERLRNEIVLLNEGLVISQVGKWAPWAEGHLTREDLQQAAREGLHRAADLYEPGRKPARAFSTYAVHWIRHHVFRLHQQARSDIRAPMGVQGLALELAPIVEATEGRDAVELRGLLIASREARGRSKRPTQAAVAAALEYMGGGCRSLQLPVGESMTLADVLPDPQAPVDEQLDRERIMSALASALSELDPEDREIVEARYGIRGPGRTVIELARSRGTARRSVEEQERRALANLRERLQGCEGAV